MTQTPLKKPKRDKPLPDIRMLLAAGDITQIESGDTVVLCVDRDMSRDELTHFSAEMERMVPGVRFVFITGVRNVIVKKGERDASLAG